MSVVVAVDGSESSVIAARAGLSLLGRPDDAVIVTVIDAPDPMQVTGTGMAGGTMSPAEFDRFERTLRASAEELTDGAARALDLPDAERRVLRGDPGRELCALAATLTARAIVIGTRGRGGLARALLGSVSDYVVRNSPCPVVITGAER